MKNLTRFLTMLFFLYLLYVGVCVTAAHPQVTPITPHWGSLFLTKVIEDARNALEILAQWWVTVHPPSSY